MSGRSKQPTKRARASRGAGSSSRPAPPSPPASDVANRFRSPAHEERYYTKIVGKSICPERELILLMGEHPDVYNNISRRGWRNFCTLPTETSEDICREFFANAYYPPEEGARKTYTSYVRGKVIRYDQDAIQDLLRTAYYDNTEISDCSFQQKYISIEYANDPVEKAREVLDCIIQPGKDWDFTKDGRPKRTFLKYLKNPAKIWFHFIVSNILPSTNHTEVLVKRATLMWAIMQEHPINLPKILSESIHDMAHNTSDSASIGHSSLIRHMCLSAGVEVTPIRGKKIKLAPRIDADWITRQLREPPRAGEQPPADTQPISRRRARPTAGEPERTVETRLSALETQVEFIRRRNRHTEKKHTMYLDYLTSQMAYLCAGREDGPSLPQPAPYDGSDEEAAFDASWRQAGQYDRAADGADASVPPEIVRDAEEDEDMDG